MAMQHSKLWDPAVAMPVALSRPMRRVAPRCLCQSHAYTCWTRDLADALQACKAADDLKANLEEEYVAVRTFIVEFCKCMDHIQHAKMLVSGCELPSRLPAPLKHCPALML